MDYFRLLTLQTFFVFSMWCRAQQIGPDPSSLWPNGIVPYTIDASFGDGDRANLNRAIADFHSKTCIRWTPRTNEQSYAHFQPMEGNRGCGSADNCYTPNTVKRASFASSGNCRNWDTMVHEMGHVLCFGHEMNRADRDNYIVASSSCAAEAKYDHLNFGHLYDYRSIMHYQYRSSNNCFKMTWVTASGSSRGLNVLDAEKLNEAYNCGGCQSYRYRFPNLTETNSNPLIAARDGSDILFPCRAYVNGDIVPGKGRMGSDPVCWLPFHGGETRLNHSFEVLTNPGRADLRWVRGVSGRIPSNAIAGGRTNSDEPLYVARCTRITGVNGQILVVPGKLHGNIPYASYNGKEYNCTNDFEVLVC